MKFEQLQKLVERGERPRIYVVDRASPPYFFTGFVTKAYKNNQLRAQLYPYIGMNVWNGRHADGGFFGSGVPPGGPEVYEGLMLDGSFTSFTTNFRSHINGVLSVIEELCKGRTDKKEIK